MTPTIPSRTLAEIQWVARSVVLPEGVTREAVVKDVAQRLKVLLKARVDWLHVGAHGGVEVVLRKDRDGRWVPLQGPYLKVMARTSAQALSGEVPTETIAGPMSDLTTAPRRRGLRSLLGR